MKKEEVGWAKCWATVAVASFPSVTVWSSKTGEA